MHCKKATLKKEKKKKKKRQTRTDNVFMKMLSDNLQAVEDGSLARGCQISGENEAHSELFQRQRLE